MRAGRRNRGVAEALPLSAGDLDAARLALAPPRRPRLRTGWVLACAVLMTAAALALCGVVVLGGWSPQATSEPPAGVRAPLLR